MSPGLRRDDSGVWYAPPLPHTFASHAKIISTICVLLLASTLGSLRSRSNRAPKVWRFGAREKEEEGRGRCRVVAAAAAREAPSLGPRGGVPSGVALTPALGWGSC